MSSKLYNSSFGLTTAFQSRLIQLLDVRQKKEWKKEGKKEGKKVGRVYVNQNNATIHDATSRHRGSMQVFSYGEKRGKTRDEMPPFHAFLNHFKNCLSLVDIKSIF